MAVDEPSEVSFFDPWSDVAVATNFLPIFVCESDLQCVDWTSSHYVRDTSYPVWELWSGPKKLYPNTRIGNDCVATGSSMPTRGYTIGIMTHY